MKPFYHYIFRDSKISAEKKPVITICYLHDDNTGITTRGIALCSRKNEFNYKIGRDIALGRAKAALQEVESARPVRSVNGFISCFVAGIKLDEKKVIKKSVWCVKEDDALNDDDLRIIKKVQDIAVRSKTKWNSEVCKIDETLSV